MSKRWLWLILVAAMLAGASAWWFTRATTAAAVVLDSAPLVRSLQFSARVATASRVDVGATVTGRVARVRQREGAPVAAGDVLVQLEDAEARAALAQALAGEAQASARLAGLRSTGRSGAQAGVAQADSVLLAARAELGRTQDLVRSGFLSPARLDEAQRAVSVAQAQQAAARAQATAISDRGSDVAQAQAQLAVAQAATQAARARLAQSTITAPTAGTVLTRDVEPGQIVQPGRALFTLALSGPLQLVAPVDERYLQQLQPGQAATVRADAFANQRFQAQVLSIAPLVDAQRGSVEVKFSVPEPPAYLREDMTLSVEVETARVEQALVLPLTALRNASDSRTDPNQATVWVVQDGRVAARQITLGLRTLEAVQVLSGLSSGDTVLVGEAPGPGARVKPDAAAGAALVARPNSGSAAADLSSAMGR